MSIPLEALPEPRKQMPLTSKQKDVASWLACGWGAKEIAAATQLSVGLVRKYLKDPRILQDADDAMTLYAIELFKQQKTYQNYVNAAVETQYALMVDPETPAAVRLSAAKSFQDRDPAKKFLQQKKEERINEHRVVASSDVIDEIKTLARPKMVLLEKKEPEVVEVEAEEVGNG